MVLEAVGLPIHALLTLEPGAKTLTQGPQLEKDERASVRVVEATVKDKGADAGE